MLTVAVAIVVPLWLAVWEGAAGYHTLVILAPLIGAGSLLAVLGLTAVASATLQERERLLYRLRILTSLAAISLVALVLAGGAWAVENGAGWVKEATATGTAGGGVLALVGARLVAATGRWRSLIARLLLQVGGVLLLSGILVWALYAGAYLLGGTRGDEASTTTRVIVVMLLTLLVFVALGVIAISIRRPGFERRLLNQLSLQDLYEARIQQTWIMSARKPGPADEPGTVDTWIRVWPGLHLSLASLRQNPPRTAYPLICSALSLPGSRGEKLPERKADSFVIGPLYTGSALTRWSRTAALEELANLTLARAAAISGAVLAPNMGERTSTTLSVIMTLLNVRIGRWVANPRPTSAGGVSGLAGRTPHFLYFREMLGQAKRDDPSIYLSDGGHFDNLGVYELFRRRCRYIVAVSADLESAQGPDKMGNLGNALRMARVDFGVEIMLGPLTPLLRHPTSGRVLSQYAVGRIRYPHVSPGPQPDRDLADASQRLEINTGYFVFIKCGIVDERLSPDLLQYLGSNPHFPYDPTTDQQFDQPQFESYRQLGFLAAEAMFIDKPAAADETASLHDRFVALHADRD
jgi:hypothetical protein